MTMVDRALPGAGGTNPGAMAPVRRLPGLALSSWLPRRYRIKHPIRALPQLLAGDPLQGLAMLRGEFSFAGECVVAVPANLFKLTGCSSVWHEELVTLTWLRHLAAAPQELAGLTARALVLSWQQDAMRKLPIQHLARALIALSGSASFLLQCAGSEFRQSFSSLIARLARLMETSFIENAETALLKATALAYASIVFNLASQTRDSALSQIAQSIDKVVLPDGGHAGRKPARLVGLALDLIPLQKALRATHVAVPARLNAAVERLLPMLRLLSHGDGGLAALQDGGQASRPALQAVLDSDTSCGRPLALAPHSGFAKLAYQSGSLIMDTGCEGPCSSPLAFEFSDAADRLIVSCGRPLKGKHPWHPALAAAAAHSTWDMDRDLATLVPSVSSEVISSPQGGLLRAGFTARGWRKHATHQRSVFLASNGCDLRGEDRIRINAAGPRECCLRFHLHPRLSVGTASHPNCISLQLPNGRNWTFSQAGGSISIEDSIYCDSAGSPQATQQIVIRSAQTAGLDVQWSLRREAEPLAGAGGSTLQA